jgi:hypothetical protein
MSKSNPDLQAAIDTRLEEAMKTQTYRLTLATQKENARMKLKNDLTFAVNGGSFIVSMELISFIAILLVAGKNETILLDMHQNPIQIDDLNEFSESIMNVYFESTNTFYHEFNKLQKLRTPKAILGVK